MRESNFSNPLQNKACVCISAAVYDRRAIDCTATLPLINSLNHLAYLTSTSPRIREMVCVDGGLERLIRILRQVPRSPPQPAVRGVVTKEMQAIWKWSLAFQCVVNIGVRGSENIRTRVVEAGMVPVAVRVLESYLRIADAIREEKKREARKEEARLRLERVVEAAAAQQGLTELTTPTAANLRRGTNALPTALSLSTLDGPRRVEARPPIPAEISAVAPADATQAISSLLTTEASTSTTHTTPSAPVIETVAPIVTAIDSDTAVSPSSSSSSVLVTDRSDEQSFRTGILTNVSSVEDFTASASGSDGAEDAEMEGEDSEMDLVQASRQRSREGSNAESDSFGDGATPRPLRRILAPLAPGEQRGDLPMTWQAVSEAVTSVAPTREATVMATPRRHVGNIADSRGRLPPPLAATTAVQTDDRTRATERSQAVPSRSQQHHHHHHHNHHHHNRGERSSENAIQPSDMIYREEEVLLSLQLLAYLSKYAHVRTLFHCDLSLLNSLETLDGTMSAGLRESVQSWSPTHPPKKNVFCIAERYTLRSSRTGLSHFAADGESRVAPEIQYWAGVIMRNACRKDENQGGIRQCANMLCGKWERQPREFAKCRRCRKAKYCSKQCQSKGWQMGHRFWCSARSDDDHPEAKGKSQEKVGNGLETANTRTEADTELDDPEQMAAGGIARDSAGDASLPTQRRHVSVGGMFDVTTQGARQRQQQQQPPPVPQLRDEQPGHAHVSPAPLQFNNRLPARGSSSLDALRRSTVGPMSQQQQQQPQQQAPPLQSGLTARRTVSAIPAHLQPSSSDDHLSNRSRTSSAASSVGDVSDMSDDEMERASRRVLANTVSPAQRSPGMTLTPLAAMTTADEELFRRASEGGDPAAANMTTRTDLAGRPLPPPVIAQHEAGLGQDIGASADEMLGLAGRLMPGAQDETDNAVFGRGDIDQMIWRGRTPLPDERHHRRGRVEPEQSAEEQTEEEEDGREIGEQQRRSSFEQSTSLLNSALLLAGSSSSSGNGSVSTASPRYPTALHAPVARQPHRFASATTTSSPLASSSMSAMSPHAFVRGSLANTFGDWRMSSSPVNSRGEATGSHHPSRASAMSSVASPIGPSDRLTSAPAFATAFDGLSGVPSARAQDDFVVPREIQDLLNTVDSSDEMQVDPL